MPQIFLSYRRNDTAYLAAALNEKLQQRFGPNSVFFDIDNIPFGVDFREHIENAVGQCSVLLAIIGDQWLGTSGDGNRRIDEEEDFVRVEIESALKGKIPIIPVLVEAATMPSAKVLPAAIKSIAFLNAAEIRAGRDFLHHIEQLIKGLESIVKDSVPEGPSPRKPWAKRNSAKSSRQIKPKSTALARTQIQSDYQTAVDKSGPDSELLEKIQKALNGYTDSHLTLGNAISPKRLAGAIKAFASEVSPHEVLLFYDNTLIRLLHDGVILTNSAVFWLNPLGIAEQLDYVNIENVKLKKGTSQTNPTRILLNQEEIHVTHCDKTAVSRVRRFFLGDVASHVPSIDTMGEINALGENLANVIEVLVEHSKGETKQ